MTIVTTSWDDGFPEDLRLAELLKQYKLSGTFYCPQKGENGRETLAAQDLHSLHAAGFEIGAHTLTHPVLTEIPRSEARTEIFQSKQRLQDTLGHEVRMFGYPRGRANRYTIRCVREAGFHGARGTELLSIERTFSRFLMPTSVQAVPYQSAGYLRNLGRRRAWGSLYRYCCDLRRYSHWVALGKRLFDDALSTDGIWHLWGHSWEIANSNQWSDLERLLKYVSRRAGVLYLNNSCTIDALSVKEPKHDEGITDPQLLPS
jgi:peptidoglycan-N-acetylglucosamine deacetylase